MCIGRTSASKQTGPEIRSGRRHSALRRLSARWRRFVRRSRTGNSGVAKTVGHVTENVSTLWHKAGQGIGFSVAFGTAVASSLMLFRVLNRTRIYGLKNIPEGHENVLYCINHCSLLDNFAFGMSVYVPKAIFKRKYIPVSLADRKNFFGDPSSRRLKDRVLRVLGRHFFRHLKAYPVDRKRADMGQVERWRELLKDNIVIVFPEGTRSRDGRVGKGKPGVGKLVYEARPIVMPVYMSGTADILGVGMRVPAVFRTVRIYIGQPIELDALLGRFAWDEHDKAQMMRNYTGVSDAIMDTVRKLNPDYHEPAAE